MASLFAVQLTPAGTGAIAVVRLDDHGSSLAVKAIETLAQISTARERQSPDWPLQIGQVKKATLAAADHTPIDEALIIRTASDTWELHLHGGIAVVEAVLEELHTLGATILKPDDSRADDLLGGPARADQLRTISQARTGTALALVLAQPPALSAWAATWRDWLKGAEPGNLWQLQSAAQWLLRRSNTLLHLLHPPRIAIVGPPNAGKSTLANALLGRPMSITSDIAGTTRDWVDAQATFVAEQIGDDPVHVAVTLVDTAGVREATDTLEQASIERTHAQAQQADAVIALFDAARVPSAAELALLETLAPARTIIAGNKMDQAAHMPEPLAALRAVPISAITSAGIGELMTRTLALLDLSRVTRNEPFAFSPRRQDLLRRIALADDASTCRDLLDALAGPPA